MKLNYSLKFNGKDRLAVEDMDKLKGHINFAKMVDKKWIDACLAHFNYSNRLNNINKYPI